MLLNYALFCDIIINKMILADVCRLCLMKEDLVWIFDKRFQGSENMKDLIYITTGVEISMKDIVSQKICLKCCELTIKMFEFRRTSLKNDRHLKEQCKQYLKENNIKIPNSEITIRRELKLDVKTENNNIKKEQTQGPAKPVFKAHPTVRELFKMYPQIKLPSICLKSDISPFVSLQLNKVEDYFLDRKLDINQHTRAVLTSNQVISEKSSLPITSTNSTCLSSSDSDTTQTVHSKDKETDENAVHSPKIAQNKPNNIKATQMHGSTNEKDPLANRNCNRNITSKLNGDTVLEMSTVDNKRKFVEVESSSEKETNKKPALTEFSDLVNRVINTFSVDAAVEAPAYVQNVSRPLHICNICSSVQYSDKDLKRHQYRHLRCQFCKTKFQTIASKKQHLKTGCIIKNAMNNPPDIELVKIEYNPEVRVRYPEAFIDFPPLEGVSSTVDNESLNLLNSCSTEPNHIDGTSNASLPAKPEMSNVMENNVEIIEILSDDEESPTSTVKSNISAAADQPLDIKNFPLLPNTNIAVPTNNTCRVSTTTKVQDSPVHTTAYTLKPDVRIRDNCILDGLNPKLSDLKLLKELLNCHLQFSAEQNIQTDLPSNRSVVVNKKDFTIELHNLKPQLYVYKIPVAIKHGKIDVTIDYHTKPKQPRKLWLWNNLAPIDIKINKQNCDKINPSKTNSAQQNNDRSGLPTTCEQNVKENTLQQSNNCFTVATSTYSSPVSSSPSQHVTTTSQCLNNSTPNPSENIVNRNPILNKYLETPVSSSSEVQTVSSSVVSSPSTQTVLCDTVVSVGTIRVKDVWELS